MIAQVGYLQSKYVKLIKKYCQTTNRTAYFDASDRGGSHLGAFSSMQKSKNERGGRDSIQRTQQPRKELCSRQHLCTKCQSHLLVLLQGKRKHLGCAQRAKRFVTRSPQAIPQLVTSRAQAYFASGSGREPALKCCYERIMQVNQFRALINVPVLHG